MQPDFVLRLCVRLSLIFFSAHYLWMNEWNGIHIRCVPSFSPRCNVIKMWLERMKIMGFIMSVGFIVITSNEKEFSIINDFAKCFFFFILFLKCSAGQRWQWIDWVAFMIVVCIEIVQFILQHLPFARQRQTLLLFFLRMSRIEWYLFFLLHHKKYFIEC